MSQRLLKLFHVAITQHVPRILARAPMIMPKYPSTARLLSSSHAVLKKSKGGNSTVKNTEPMDVTPQLDLDGVVTQMFSAVKHCDETVRSMVGSLGRIDASILDDVRVSTGKGVKPTPLHDYATVGVRDDDNKLLSKNDSQREAKKVCGIYMLTL